MEEFRYLGFEEDRTLLFGLNVLVLDCPSVEFISAAVKL